MGTNSNTTHLVVALNLPTAEVKFILKAKSIYKAMLNNPNFTSSAARLVILNTNIIALDAAQIACSTTLPSGTTASRNAVMALVKTDLLALKNDVQEAADANPAKAEAIIKSASMDIKETTIPNKRKNAAYDGDEEGIVILTGEGPGAHDWRGSSDGKTWFNIPSTLTSKTEVRNLVSGQVYYFQNRRVLPNNVRTDWSQMVKFRLK